MPAIADQRFDRIGPFVYPRFTPTLPPLENGHETKRHRVAIVGGGPVGLALALGLARFGVPSVVIEADDTVCMGSRAICTSRRSLEIMERLGVLGDFMAKGLPWTDGRSFYGETEVFRLSMPHDATQRLPPMINLQQYYIEQFLVDAIGRVNQRAPGCIDIRWVSQVRDLEVGGDGVALDVANPLGEYRLAADWVVACDGGQSFVRTQLGLPMRGTTNRVIAGVHFPVDNLAGRFLGTTLGQFFAYMADAGDTTPEPWQIGTFDGGMLTGDEDMLPNDFPVPDSAQADYPYYRMGTWDEDPPQVTSTKLAELWKLAGDECKRLALPF